MSVNSTKPGAEREDLPPFLIPKPPHLAARGLAYLLMLLFAAVVATAILVQAPETISAPFVLVPQRGADPVRALRRGIVEQVAVAEGQAVAQGDKLFVIRSEQASDQAADLGTMETQRKSAGENLTFAKQKYESQQLANAEERRRLQGGLEHFQRLIELKNGELASARDVAENYAQLRREGLASLTVVRDKQLEVSRLTGQLEQLRNEQRDTHAAIEKLSHDADMQLTEYRERESQLKEEVEKTKIRIASRKGWVALGRGDELVVPAPCAGTIIRLQIKAGGAVVSDGEVLCELACSGEQLQAELQIPQTGAGRVKPGQGVKLLYDSFPYQQFGVKFGALRWISPTTSAPAFRALASIADESITVSGQPMKLKAGMGGRAEIVIAKRSLISFAFDPIRQLRENLASPPNQ